MTDEQCQHNFVFLRQERYNPQYSRAGEQPGDITEDVFCCSKCLEYRRVEIQRDDDAVSRWKRGYWKQAVVASPGWLAVFLGPDPPGYWCETVAVWIVYDDDESEVGVPTSDIEGLIAPDGPYLQNVWDRGRDFGDGTRFWRYIREEDLASEAQRLTKLSRDWFAGTGMFKGGGAPARRKERRQED